MMTDTTETPGADYALAYCEARRGSEEQDRAATELRSRAGALIATYLERGRSEPLDLHLIQRDLALHIGHSTAFNRRRLKMLMRAFRVATLLLVVEVVALIVALLT
jgi:hypothetical protein